VNVSFSKPADAPRCSPLITECASRLSNHHLLLFPENQAFSRKLRVAVGSESDSFCYTRIIPQADARCKIAVARQRQIGREM
jgi:hypothetical protein